jgi:hypothetical protein
MTTKKANRFNLDDQERAVIKALTDATETKQELLAQLGNGNDVSDQIAGINTEIAQHESQLATFKAAREARARANSVSACKERHASNAAEATVALEEGKRIADLATDVIVQIAALGNKLDEIASLKGGFASRLRDVVLSTQGSEAKVPARLVDDQHEQIFRVVDALTLPTYFRAALWHAGIGRTGIVPGYGVSIEGVPAPDANPTFDYSDPSEEIARVLAKLQNVVGSVTAMSATANGVKAAA